MGDPNSDQKMDDLIDLMKSSNSLNDYTATEKHPHFDNYKNVGKIANSQKERRAEHLERQKNRRNDSYNRHRSLFDETSGEKKGDEIEYVMEVDEKRNPFKKKTIPIYKKYKDRLMLSEWLIDIPNELQGSWTMVVSPKGKRCLVVAEEGITSVYTKHGYKSGQFESGIPGGGELNPREKTILDCIMQKNRFYILDVIYANSKSFSEIEAIQRFEEIDIILKNINKKETYTKHFFKALRCPCNNEEMTKIMTKPLEFDINGLLYYNNDGWYTSGYTPLVGWLEPWMLPEVVNIPIHRRYNFQKKNDLPLKEYVDDFNDKHNHHFVHGKSWEEIEVPEDNKKEEDEKMD
uniref:Snurportin-1 n=1 Tax=Panagrolaimus davidi TaxID=227884 RepID=A0A914PZR3_9BILA